MKGRNSKKQSPSEELKNTEGVEIKINPVTENSTKEETVVEENKVDDTQSPSEELKNTEKNGDIPKNIILKAIKFNPQYNKFYLNKKGFVFTLGTPKKQMGDVVLINTKDFK